MSAKHGDIFAFCKRTIEEIGNLLTGQNANSLEKQVALFHYVRAGYLLNAIYTLITHGFATEAMVILRSLLNLYINIKWLNAGDSKERYERFGYFEAIFKWQAIQTLDHFVSTGANIDNKHLNHCKKCFEFVKEKYGLKNNKDYFNWSGLSISKMASDEGVDLQEEYKLIYSQLSAIEHTSPETVRQYLDKDTETVIGKITVGPREENITLVLITAMQYFFHVRAITCEVFGLAEDAYRSQTEAWEKIENKYWRNDGAEKK